MRENKLSAWEMDRACHAIEFRANAADNEIVYVWPKDEGGYGWSLEPRHDEPVRRGDADTAEHARNAADKAALAAGWALL